MKPKIMWAILAVILLVVVYVMGSHQVVRTSDGYEFLERENFSLGNTWVDTRDWGPLDWVKNHDVAAALAKKKLKSFKKEAIEDWSTFSSKLEKKIDDFDFDKKSDKVAERLKQVRHSAKKQFEDLGRRLEKKDISWDGFVKSMKDLEKWTEHEIEKIKSEK